MMATTKHTIDYVGSVVFDDETGEVISYIKDPRREPPKKLLPPEGERYVGIELKYLSECTTKKDMIKTLRSMDGFYMNKPKVNTEELLEMATEDMLTPQQLRMVKFIGENLTGWNYCITTTSEIREATRVSKNNFARVLSSLSPEYLRVQHRDDPKRGDIVLKINPRIAWKGDYTCRDAATNNWYEH